MTSCEDNYTAPPNLYAPSTPAAKPAWPNRFLANGVEAAVLMVVALPTLVGLSYAGGYIMDSIGEYVSQDVLFAICIITLIMNGACTVALIIITSTAIEQFKQRHKKTSVYRN